MVLVTALFHMKRKHILSSAVLAIAVSLPALILPAVSMRAATVYVPNGSFESPATTFVDTRIDSWQKAPKPDWYAESSGYTWDELTGVFANTATNSADHIDNCDGAQAMGMFAVPDVADFQDYNSIDW